MNFQDFKNKWETDIKPNRHPDEREGQSSLYREWDVIDN
jgi:hypothetical protein